GEARLTRSLHRRRVAAQTDLDLDARALERVAQVLGLRRALRAPADHADLLDAGEGLGQQRQQVPAADHDALFLATDVDDLLFEHLGLEIEIGRHGRASGEVALR